MATSCGAGTTSPPARDASDRGGTSSFGSGPVATIIQDVLSLLIYLAITTFMLA
jgi:hypothetical protein